MEVHQHSHTARKKWTHYLWEFLMLFLAVFCGFMAENIREHNIEKHRAHEYAVMLRVDLINDTLQLDNYMKFKDSISQKFSEIRRIFEKDHDSITFREFDYLKDNGMDLSVFIPNNATYEQMKYSGSLRYFHNTTLLSKLGLYDAAKNRFVVNWEVIREFYGGVKSPYFLQFLVHSDRFHKKYNDQPGNTYLTQKGFDFTAWDETGKIFENLTQNLEVLNDYAYPDLKENATELILLLSKEYHLK